MRYQAIFYDVRNHIGFVTLNRPQVLNAVNQQMRREIIDVCERMRADSEVRACNSPAPASALLAPVSI